MRRPEAEEEGERLARSVLKIFDSFAGEMTVLEGVEAIGPDIGNGVGVVGLDHFTQLVFDYGRSEPGRVPVPQ